MSVAEARPLLVADATALASEEWLPEGTGWDDLDEIRKTHLRLLQNRLKVVGESAAIRERHDEEDKQRADAIEAAYREGVEPDVPEPTPPEERQAEVEAAEEKARAASRALDDFLRETEQEITDRCDDWLADMDEKDRAAQAKLDEAKRVAAQALADVQSRRKLRMWLHREAGRHPTFKDSAARHYPWGEMADPPIVDNTITPEVLRGGVTQ